LLSLPRRRRRIRVRLKQEIAVEGITFFAAIDQSKLAAGAGVSLHPSTLLVFGNPALGAQFLTSNPTAGLDWPVRSLVYQDKAGVVWAAHTDFAWSRVATTSLTKTLRSTRPAR
jgi:uncharacterized protein (DUF302 family)